ncbi:flagellar basal-body rod protein FlgF [Rhizobiales bacterium GAS188]|jgi:flagellar basal-body rod protein FlgF|nr:flagellar basal-body rod protein FlgF [Rhizobiales bacterium GAS188]
MQSGLYVSLSAQLALRKRVDTIANNVANMNTAGFRADEVRFQALVEKAGSDSVAFASTGSEYISRRIGGMTRTNNPLDVAVQGDGWFAVKTPGGTTYTRDGRMQLSETGTLQNVQGYQMLDAGGTPLVIDPAAGPPTIASDGMISQNGNQVGAIGLFKIDDQAKLSRSNFGGVVPDKPATAVLDFAQNGVVQGFVENANVNPVMEMTKLIMVSHDFDGVSSMIQSSESSLTEAIKTLGSQT